MLGRGRGLLERMWPMATHEASDGASSMRERGRGWGCWSRFVGSNRWCRAREGSRCKEPILRIWCRDGRGA